MKQIESIYGYPIGQIATILKHSIMNSYKKLKEKNKRLEEIVNLLVFKPESAEAILTLACFLVNLFSVE